MYNVADDFWDSYFRNKQEARSLRRQTGNNPGDRGIISAGTNEMFDRRLHMQAAVRSNGYRPQDARIQGDTHFKRSSNGHRDHWEFPTKP